MRSIRARSNWLLVGEALPFRARDPFHRHRPHVASALHQDGHSRLATTIRRTTALAALALAADVTLIDFYRARQRREQRAGFHSVAKPMHHEPRRAIRDAEHP